MSVRDAALETVELDAIRDIPCPETCDCVGGCRLIALDQIPDEALA